MRNLILIALFAVLSLVVAQQPSKKVKLFSLQSRDVNENWLTFKSDYGRLYSNQTFESRRLGVFRNNLQKINDHNKKFNTGLTTFSLGITNFADWTENEFMKYVQRGLLIRPKVKLSRNQTEKKVSYGRADLPESVDWRTQGFVNPVRDQGQCGSCWTFSAVSSLESHYYKTNGELLEFSEQHLVDCAYLSQGQTGSDADGCQGGWMTEAFKYIKSNNGVSLLDSYPYSSASSGKWSGKCKSTGQNLGGQISSYVEVTSGNGDEAAVTAALANVGPLAVAVYVTSDFQHYTSGVFTDTSCPSGKLNHAVNLVGYGTQGGQDYYIMRNSWGSSWGIDGYMLYRRNNKNQCGIASYASYPVVKPANNQPQPSPIVKPTTPKPAPTPRPAPTLPTTLPVRTTTRSQTIKCASGTGWYLDPGCKTASYCTQIITNYKCPDGYLLDPAAGTCKLSGSVRCPV